MPPMSAPDPGPRAPHQPAPTEPAAELLPTRPGIDAPRTSATALQTFWSRRSPQLLLLALIGLGVWRYQAAQWHWRDALILLIVWATFPINEWLIHMHMLHYRPRRILGRTVNFRLPWTHRQHHADPWNLRWVFIPLHIYPLVLIPVGLACAFAGEWRPPLLTFVFSYLLLGLHYEWVHYLAHIAWCPPLAYYRRRVLEHRLHHFRSENHWWGVSMGLGDRLFGTAPDPRDVAPTGTTRDIGA